MSPILLDTHAALWSSNGTLRTAVSKTIDAAAKRGELLLSPITAWEIATLVRKGRLVLASTPQDFVRTLFTSSGVVVATITPAIAAGAGSLPGEFHGDPADRILVATATAYGAQIVTRDKGIREYAKVSKHIRCIAC
jgi:PIN domain nuclease of toxin-antitoxin system